MDTDATPAGAAVSTESAHTTSRKSAPTLRLDLIPRGERCRWTTEQKQMIAAQSLAPGASPPNIARLNGISTGQLYTWRHTLKAAQPGAAVPSHCRSTPEFDGLRAHFSALMPYRMAADDRGRERLKRTERAASQIGHLIDGAQPI
jgi:transposase-like protein